MLQSVTNKTRSLEKASEIIGSFFQVMDLELEINKVNKEQDSRLTTLMSDSGNYDFARITFKNWSETDIKVFENILKKEDISFQRMQSSIFIDIDSIEAFNSRKEIRAYSEAEADKMTDLFTDKVNSELRQYDLSFSGNNGVSFQLEASGKKGTYGLLRIKLDWLEANIAKFESILKKINMPYIKVNPNTIIIKFEDIKKLGASLKLTA